MYDVDAPELRALLSFAMVQAVNDYRCYAAPRPTVIGERLFAWFADAVTQSVASRPLPSPHGPCNVGAAPSDAVPRLRLCNGGRW